MTKHLTYQDIYVKNIISKKFRHSVISVYDLPKLGYASLWSINFSPVRSKSCGEPSRGTKDLRNRRTRSENPFRKKLSITKFSKILKRTFFQLVTKFQINFFFSESSFSSFLRRLNFVADNIGIRYQFLFLLLLIWFLVIPRNCSGPVFFSAELKYGSRKFWKFSSHIGSSFSCMFVTWDSQGIFY